MNCYTVYIIVYINNYHKNRNNRLYGHHTLPWTFPRFVVSQTVIEITISFTQYVIFNTVTQRLIKQNKQTKKYSLPRVNIAVITAASLSSGSQIQGWVWHSNTFMFLDFIHFSGALLVCLGSLCSRLEQVLGLPYIWPQASSP